ncbi:hypothetical protein [Prosthecomicrobium pneumaticum]|uniref:Uncharacterized protein n=1 Tax=Prosthecomicrobium pneumaticum TaxID=81895 RepID=A0A7W9FPG9_9HYPH|nr:hypothetical protein [Prosthecomicrobium pneumaticum]MBB5754383.1 hypothetical protein [Prosthecomicrobium pneumaticum]
MLDGIGIIWLIAIVGGVAVLGLAFAYGLNRGDRRRPKVRSADYDDGRRPDGSVEGIPSRQRDAGVPPHAAR